MKTYLIQRFGNNGAFIETDDYYEPPDPVEPTRTNIRDKVALSVYEDALKSRAKLMNQHLQERDIMFEVIQVGNDSKQTIENHFKAARADADGRKDPLKLWNIIASTHLITSNGYEALDKAEAESYYDKIHQGNHGSLGDYKLSYDRAIEALVMLQHNAIPAVEERVIHFIKSLNEAGHFEWKSKTINDIKGGGIIPGTVEAAHELCYNYRPLIG